MFEYAESVVVLGTGTGTGLAWAGREIVWVVFCIESGVVVAMGVSSAVGAGFDAWAAGEAEAGLWS